jgi:hypothetical protein
MYEMEKAERAKARRQSGVKGGMPKKWTHLDFLTELVYDLIYPAQTATHRSTIGELDDRSIDSTKSFSSFASVDESVLEEEVDLDCTEGREAYLEQRMPTVMTKKAMATNKPWPKRYDGLRHASLPVHQRHCQYWYYQYAYEFDDSQREVNPTMQRNRAHLRRCLVCNVNLCSICEIEFHGVRMCESAKLLGK